MKFKWRKVSDELPPSYAEVMTKIDDEDGLRNEKVLMLYQFNPSSQAMWFCTDGSTRVYYTPTHWAYFHDRIEE